MYFWVNFLHFYLPPTTEKQQLDEAVQKSYEWILLMAEKYPDWHFTLNITGCLTEALYKYGYKKIVDRFCTLIQRGQLELVDSLSHHPIAPLIGPSIIQRQIEQQQKINKKFYATKRRGFFLPEMAYNEGVGRLLAKQNYDWLILDEINFKGKLNQVDWQNAYILKNSNLKIIFRSREWSLDYPPRKIAKALAKHDLPKYIITATDAELYGLRFNDFEGWLGRILENPKIKTVTVSQYLQKLATYKYIKPRAANWESLESELKNKFNFSLWRGQKNKIHNLLWQLANMATLEIKKHPDDVNFDWAIKHLDNGLASCTFWWASNRDFKLFGAPAWHPEEVEKGALELIKTIRTLQTNKSTKLKAEKIYHELKYLLWTTHWQNYGQ